MKSHDIAFVKTTVSTYIYGCCQTLTTTNKLRTTILQMVISPTNRVTSHSLSMYNVNMNVLGKRLHSCLFREITYQINYQNKSKVNNYQITHLSNNAENKQNPNNAKKEVSYPKGLTSQIQFYKQLFR